MAGNNKPKLDLKPGEEARLTLIKDEPTVGRSEFGPYSLYSVVTEDGTEMVFFANPELDKLIKDHKLGKGSHFILRRPHGSNGQKPKLEIAAIGPESVAEDNYKAILAKSIRDALEIVKETGIQFSNDEIQKLAVSLFIQRVRIQ
jgi:hypothetical protein